MVFIFVFSSKHYNFLHQINVKVYCARIRTHETKNMSFPNPQDQGSRRLITHVNLRNLRLWVRIHRIYIKIDMEKLTKMQWIVVLRWLHIVAKLITLISDLDPARIFERNVVVCDASPRRFVRSCTPSWTKRVRRS